MAIRSSEKSKYLILEVADLSPVLPRSKQSQRVKYTCFDVSQNLLIFGATSGSLYVFKRDPCQFLQLLPNKEGSVNHIAISPDEKLIAFSTKRGVTCVLECLEGGGTKVLNRSIGHAKSDITVLEWGGSSNHLFAGDNIGRVSVINVFFFKSSNIFQVPAFIFLKFDSEIVQISSRDDSLLVSTQTRCYIYDIAKEHYLPIGRQLREGRYGACFFGTSEDNSKIFCARPGSRLWEVHINGSVLSTHQFKEALGVVGAPIVSLRNNDVIISNKSVYHEQPSNFPYLSSVCDKYLFSFNSSGLFIFDPEKVDVVLWSNHYEDIYHAKCVNDCIYVWDSTGIFELNIITINKCLLRLYFAGNYDLCVQLFDAYSNELNNPQDLIQLSPLLGLKDHSPQIDQLDNVNVLLESLSKVVASKQLSTRLDSGIFLVENKHLKWKMEKKQCKKLCRTVPKPSELRSRSLPPKPTIEKENEYDGCNSCSVVYTNATNSLPELRYMSPYKSEPVEEPTEGSSITRKKTSVDDDNNPGYDDYLFSQIPFLSLTSPDVIQNTIVELGQNVSGKLVSGTQSLRDKWQVLEGRFKFLKIGSVSEDINKHKAPNILPTQSNRPPISIEDQEDEIVANRRVNFPPKINKAPTFDIQCIYDICDKLNVMNEHTVSEEKKCLFSEFLNFIITKNSEYHKCLKSSSITNYNFGFPFMQFTSEKYINVIQQHFHNILKSNYLKEYLGTLTIDSKIKGNNVCHPDILCDIYSENDLILDLKLKYLVIIFSEILEPFTILECLHLAKLNCVFVSWCTVLEIFQESAFNYITEKNDFNVNYTEWPLPLLLNTLFLMFRLDQIESSCHMAIEGKVSFKDISYLIMRLCLHLKSTGVDKEEANNRCYKLLLECLSKSINSKALIFEDISDEICTYVEKAFIYINGCTSASCTCGYPVYPLKKKTNYPLVGELLISIYLFNFFNDTSSLNRLLSNKSSSNATDNPGGENGVCDKFQLRVLAEHWLYGEKLPVEYKKIIKLLQVMPECLLTIVNVTSCSNNNTDVVPFLVQFGLPCDVGLDNGSISYWERVCNFQEALGKGVCCICKDKISQPFEITWSGLANSMLKCIGVHKTLSLLTKFSHLIPPGQLDIGFYRACLLSSMVVSEPSNFHATLIESYFKKLNMPTTHTRLEVSDVKNWKVETETPLQVLSSENKSEWGILLDLSVDVCLRCSLTLKSENLVQDGGVRAFRCGHVYHVVCLRLSKSLYQCPLCKNS